MNDKFYPADQVSFVPVEYISVKTKYKTYGAYLIELQDRTKAYLPGDAFGTFLSPGVNTRGTAISNSPKDLEPYSVQRIFTENPALISERHERETAIEKAISEAKREADRQAWSKKGGVKIGMSTTQVLDSWWGAPIKVNRTTTAKGVAEQWIYPENKYLYFINSKITAIQD